MARPPRPRGSGVIDRRLLLRAWLLLGSTSAVLVMAGFFLTLTRAGWHPGDATGSDSPLHHAYLLATTMSFAGILACQIGTAFAARTDRASLSTVGVGSNPLLLWGLAFELLFTAAVIYLPPLQDVLATTGLGLPQLALLLPFPLVVWGADELFRLLRRRFPPAAVLDLVPRQPAPAWRDRRPPTSRSRRSCRLCRSRRPRRTCRGS